MLPSDFSDKTAGLKNSLGNFFTGLGQRLIIHVLALTAALFAKGTAHLAGSGLLTGVSFGFSIYIGLICLVPRGIGKRADWLIPTGSGLFLILLWMLWGIPWQFACIWGGALTWSIRRIMRKGQIDWEWTVLPWLVICLYSSMSGVLPLASASPPLWTFPVLAAAGWGAALLYGKFRSTAAQKELLLDGCNRLEKKLAARALPPELDSAVLALINAVRRYLKLNPALGKDSADFVSAFSLTVDRVSGLGSNAVAEMRQKCLSAVNLLREKLEERLLDLERQRQGESLQDVMDTSLAARIGQFHDSATQLREKSRTLPAAVKSHADGIALATDAILACMRDDPEDVSPGDRFLSRYLKAAHSLVDDYRRLSSQGAASQSVAEALARSESLLERLRKAFEEEHARLLQNDAINFTAELNVLDKLLKMDGR